MLAEVTGTVTVCVCSVLEIKNLWSEHQFTTIKLHQSRLTYTGSLHAVRGADQHGNSKQQPTCKLPPWTLSFFCDICGLMSDAAILQFSRIFINTEDVNEHSRSRVNLNELRPVWTVTERQVSAISYIIKNV